MYHKNLEVYKKSIEFVAKIYEITRQFPDSELYGLTSQIKRAAVSIPSNIAEGCARCTDKQTANFLNVAIGSLAEVETHLEIAKVLGYVKDTDNIDTLYNNLKSLLLGLKKHIKSKIKT